MTKAPTPPALLVSLALLLLLSTPGAQAVTTVERELSDAAGDVQVLEDFGRASGGPADAPDLDVLAFTTTLEGARVNASLRLAAPPVEGNVYLMSYAWELGNTLTLRYDATTGTFSGELRDAAGTTSAATVDGRLRGAALEWSWNLGLVTAECLYPPGISAYRNLDAEGRRSLHDAAEPTGLAEQEHCPSADGGETRDVPGPSAPFVVAFLLAACVVGRRPAR